MKGSATLKYEKACFPVPPDCDMSECVLVTGAWIWSQIHAALQWTAADCCIKCLSIYCTCQQGLVSGNLVRQRPFEFSVVPATWARALLASSAPAGRRGRNATPRLHPQRMKWPSLTLLAPVYESCVPAQVMKMLFSWPRHSQVKKTEKHK